MASLFRQGNIPVVFHFRRRSTETDELRLIQTYRVGNEYRASKKSVEENKKIVKAVLTYQDKKTMSVPDVMRILGLGKTATYRLINQCRFKTYLVLGKMRVDVDSFEDWYAGQFHYEKVNGERPGKNTGKHFLLLLLQRYSVFREAQPMT